MRADGYVIKHISIRSNMDIDTAVDVDTDFFLCLQASRRGAEVAELAMSLLDP